jgi:hypothetical protein
MRRLRVDPDLEVAQFFAQHLGQLKAGDMRGRPAWQITSGAATRSRLGMRRPPAAVVTWSPPVIVTGIGLTPAARSTSTTASPAPVRPAPVASAMIARPHRASVPIKTLTCWAIAG